MTAAADGPAIAITFPHSLGTPGGGTVGCIEICRALRAAGARVTLLTVATRTADRRLFHAPPLQGAFLGEAAQAALRDRGIAVHSVPPHRLHVFLDGLPTRRAVGRLRAAQRVDAVLGWHQEYAFLPARLRRSGVATGLFAAGQYDYLADIRRAAVGARQRGKWYLERSLLRRAARHADTVYAISRYTRDEVVRVLGISPDRVVVAPWGIDPVFAAVARAGPGPRVSRFLFFGSPARRKGGFEVLEAFARLGARGELDWSLKLVWTRRAELERVAREHGIAERVTVLDPTDHGSLARELEWAQVAVLPSRFESFGLACAEALASGVPVVAFDTGGVAEVVRHGHSGWLVPNGRVDALVDAVVEARRDPARTFEMGLAGRRDVAALSWERTARMLLQRIAAGAGVPA